MPPSRTKGNKVTKPRRASRKAAILPGSAEEQAALFAQHANGTAAFLRPRSSGQQGYHSSGGGGDAHHGHDHRHDNDAMESTLHFPSVSLLASSSGGSDHKPLSFYSDVDVDVDAADAEDAFAMINPVTGAPRNAEELILDTYGDVIKIDSALCRKLAAQVAVRPPAQRRIAQRLNMVRRSNVEALLAQVTGELPARPCKNCHKGHGPWTECVIYDGQMCGSCANCWYNASGSRCTFHGTFVSSRQFIVVPLYYAFPGRMHVINILTKPKSKIR